MWRHIFPLCWNRSCQPVSYPVFLLSMAEHSFSEIQLRAKKFSLAPLVFTHAKVTWLKKKRGKKLEVLASRSVLSLLLTSLSWEDMLLWAFSVKKNCEDRLRKMPRSCCKIFFCFRLSRHIAWSQRALKCCACVLSEQCVSAYFVDFHRQCKQTTIS